MSSANSVKKIVGNIEGYNKSVEGVISKFTSKKGKKVEKYDD